MTTNNDDGDDDDDDDNDEGANKRTNERTNERRMEGWILSLTAIPCFQRFTVTDKQHNPNCRYLGCWLGLVGHVEAAGTPNG